MPLPANEHIIRNREYAEAFAQWQDSLSPEEKARTRELGVDEPATDSHRSSLGRRDEIALASASEGEPPGEHHHDGMAQAKIDVVLAGIQWATEVSNPRNRGARVTALGLMLGGPAMFNCSSRREVCEQQGVPVRTVNHLLLSLRAWGRFASSSVAEMVEDEK